ncbi:hypothetical protein P8452_14629 [Trifolium repens]|nr:hypothetical protein P8452_14629 [Trifolium repens]
MVLLFKTTLCFVCSIINNISSISTTVISLIKSRRISNELGARRPNDAYLAVFDTLFMGLTCGVLEFSLMMSIRKCT